MNKLFYGKSFALIFSLCVLLLGISREAEAQRAMYSSNEIKAVFIHKIVKYTTFIPEAFDYPTENIRLGIIGKDPFGSKIELIFKGRPIGSHYWQIRRVKTIKDLWRSHVVFVPNTEKAIYKDVIEYCKKFPTLTVGDNINGFCESGGIINFTSDPYKFEINIEAAKRSKLILDSRLLRLASRIVTP